MKQEKIGWRLKHAPKKIQRACESIFCAFNYAIETLDCLLDSINLSDTVDDFTQSFGGALPPFSKLGMFAPLVPALHQY